MPYSAQSDRDIYELFARTRVPRVYICKDGQIKQIFTDQRPQALVQPGAHLHGIGSLVIDALVVDFQSVHQIIAADLFFQSACFVFRPTLM